MKFKQHIPNFVEGDEAPFEIEFDTLDQLLEIPIVRSFRLAPGTDTAHAYFKNYSISYMPTGYLLMAEYDYVEKKWPISHWVVGYLSGGDIESLGLPALRPFNERIIIKETKDE